MGYMIWQAGEQFSIAAEHKDDALAAVKAATTPGYAWVDTEGVQSARTLEEALRAWRWMGTSEDSGDISGIEFKGEKAGDDEILWSAIAPYVTSGSFIEMVGEEGERWRWKFDDGECREVIAKVVWDE